MSLSIGDFIGSWQFTSIGGITKLAQQGGYLLIGTGSGWGDTPPCFSGSYEVLVGFAVLDAQEQPLLATGDHEGEQPLVLMQEGNQLKWKGYYDQQPLYITVAAAEIETVGGRYVSIFGNTVYGDPDQVAVWGGSGTPPPTFPGT